MNYKILVIDDVPKNIEVFKRILEPHGFVVHSATTGHDGVVLLKRSIGGYALAIVDYLMPDLNGAETTKLLLEVDPSLNVVTCSGDDSQEAFDKNLAAGSVYYIQRGMDTERILSVVRRYCRKFEETRRLVKREPAITNAEKIVESVGMIGRSRHLAEVASLIRTYGPTMNNVLVLGENGTGKERVARAIHDHSPVRAGRFVGINCGAIAEGLLESELFGHERGSFTGADRKKDGLFLVANKGTIFLDEIGELPLRLQVKLLRVLQEKEFTPVGGTRPIHSDARVIAATNVNIEKAIETGKFREDLFYRINVLPLTLKPLRDRLEDIEPLVAFFTELENQKNKTSKYFLAPTVAKLRKYDWPGNVRELENYVKRLMVICPGPVISPEDLDERFYGNDEADEIIYNSFKEKQDEEEKSFLLRIFSQTKSVRETARKLALPPSTLYGRMKTLGIETVEK